MVRAPGGRCPRRKLWAEAGVTVAGSGGRADAPAPGMLRLSCPEPWFPEHMLFPPPKCSSLLLPQASLSCLARRQMARTTLLASDPRHPAQLLLPSRPHGRFSDLPGAPLWTASAQHPRRQALGACGARRANAGMNKHALLCPFPAARFPPDAAGRSLFGATEEEKGTAWGPWGWEEWTGWGVCAPHPLLLSPARPLGRVTAAPGWGSALHSSILRARLGTLPGPPAGS